jgi:hypothetical protein
MFYRGRMRNCEEEPRFGRGYEHPYGYGSGTGFGYGHGFGYYGRYDKDHLEFAKKELELRLEYLTKEIANHPDDPELNFEKREIENKISYIGDLIAKAEK